MNIIPLCLRSGKNSKFTYFARAFARELVPWSIYRARREGLLESIASRPDRDEIEARAAYCCRLDPAAPVTLSDAAQRLRDQPLPKKKHTYYFDSREYLRYFPRDLRWFHVPGDVTKIPPEPAIVKSRPIAEDLGGMSVNARSVLLNEDKVRHFTFVHDKLRFEEKISRAIFRGVVRAKPKRITLFEKYFGRPGYDLGDTSSRPVRPEWLVGKISIADHLRCRYILAIEGNDVASNLKWVMSSNSLAVMPCPQYETWFQEGLLVPGVHFVEIRKDYEDLPEKIAWYDAHPEEAEKIIAAAHAWVARFQDPSRERLVSLRVLDRYFRGTGQQPH
ncbi:MAG: lipopolysaccharide biosynthesis protein [Kiritimatiellae bacterium]|nr:lipopolysaccharide biosynthesis protein [Kiritimatiellia bacterium]